MRAGEVFVDPRDGNEYPTFVTKKGTRWMGQNLDFNVQGARPALGLSDTKIFGNMYSYEMLDEAIPAGWKIPTVKEWKVMRREYNPALFNLSTVKSTAFGREYAFWTSSAKRTMFAPKVEGSMCLAKLINDNEFYIFYENMTEPCHVRCVQYK